MTTSNSTPKKNNKPVQKITEKQPAPNTAPEQNQQEEIPYFQRLGWASRFHVNPLPKNFVDQLKAMETNEERFEALELFAKGDFKGSMDLRDQILKENDKVFERVKQQAQQYEQYKQSKQDQVRE